MKHLIKPLLIACLVIAGFSVVAGATKRAYAATSDTAIAQTGPVPLSGEYYPPGGTNFTPWFAVGTGGFNGAYMYAKVYVNVNASGGNQAATLTIQNGDGICPNTGAQELGIPSVDYHMIDLSASEIWAGAIGNGYKTGDATSNPNHACGDLQMNIPANAGIASSVPGHEKWAVFYFEAHITNPSGTNEKQFRLSVTNGLVGISRPVRDYGFDSTDGHDRGYFAIYNYGGVGDWDYGVQIAPRCGEYTSDTSAPVGMYDADNFTYNQPNLEYTVIRDTKGPAAPTWSAPIVDVGRGGLGDNHQYNTQSMNFTANTTYRYKLNFYGIATINTIQIKIPFDEIDASPLVTCPAPPPPDGQCNIVTGQPIRTAPSTPVSFQVRITARPGSGDLTDPPIRLGITQPIGQTLKFDFGGTITAGNSKDITVTINTVPGVTGPYNNYRTYRLENNGVPFGGSCQVDLLVTSAPNLHGDLIAASCQIIRGHIWKNNSDTTATQGRLHITSNTDPANPIDTYTKVFATWGSAYNGGVGNPQPDNIGGKFFDIDPYNYNVLQPVGPYIDIQLDYHHVYQITLQWQDPSDPTGNTFYDASDPSGNLATKQMEYPCITGGISASCTSVTGSLSFRSTDVNDTAGRIVSDSIYGGVPFNAHYNFGPYDPFNAGQMGGQLFPHGGHNFNLQFRDFDGNYYQAVDASGGAVAVPLDTCLKFDDVCKPSPVSMEIGTTTSSDFSYGYSNLTSHNWANYNGVLTSDGTVLINNSQGPIGSTAPGDIVYAPGGVFTWNNTQVSSTGASPYDGKVYEAGYFNGSRITPLYPCEVDQLTKPYFKAFGASVSTGGAFADSGAANSSTCSGTQRQGGAKAFAHFVPYANNAVSSYSKLSQKYGASVEYSIESLGLVEGQNPRSLGFYSGDTHDPAGDYINTLDLGDQTLSWGGKLGGSHCVPDYYDGEYTGNESIWFNRSVDQMFSDASFPAIRAEAFKASPGANNAIYLDGGSNLPSNTRATLFVNGDVYINSNITYNAGSFDPNDPNSKPPFFTLIANGNIYVDPSVTELDGLYVAQGDNGFSTCAQKTANDAINMPKASIWPTCSSRLVVNGAVVASQLKLLRVGDQTNTLNNAVGDNGSSLIPGKNNKAVEEFNYTPQMIENSPYYMGVRKFGSNERVFSLPPIY